MQSIPVMEKKLDVLACAPTGMILQNLKNELETADFANFEAKSVKYRDLIEKFSLQRSKIGFLDATINNTKFYMKNT